MIINEYSYMTFLPEQLNYNMITNNHICKDGLPLATKANRDKTIGRTVFFLPPEPGDMTM